jgi:hypothetical protein
MVGLPHGGGDIISAILEKDKGFSPSLSTGWPGRDIAFYNTFCSGGSVMMCLIGSYVHRVGIVHSHPTDPPVDMMHGRHGADWITRRSISSTNWSIRDCRETLS